MGAVYDAYNFTRRERLGVYWVGAGKARELVWNDAAAALTVWYLLWRRGDEIALISDYDVEDKRTFFGQRVSYELLNSFTEVFEEALAHAVRARALIDHGWVLWYPDDPVLRADPLSRTRKIEVDHRSGDLPSEGL